MKTLFTFALSLICVAVFAQDPVKMLTTARKDSAVVSNSGTSTGSLKATVSATGKHVRVLVRVKRNSGTVGGKIYHRVSINGVDYIAIDSQTVTNTAGNKTYLFKEPDAAYKNHEVYYVSTGTMNSTIWAWIREKI